MADRLTSKQRAHLRGLAHSLKPAHQIGKEGVTPAALQAIREAFHRRELLKIRVLENAPEEARETAYELAEALEGVQVAQVIGRTVTLYRPDPDNPQITLPR